MGILRGLGNVVTHGMIDKRKAKNLKLEAEHSLEMVQNDLEESRESTEKVLNAYVNMRLSIAAGVIRNFIDIYSQIGDIRQGELDKHYEQIPDMPEVNIQEMKRITVSAGEIAGAAGAAAVTGAAAVAGAWGIAGLIGTASTGTAISTLAGAAKVKSTLAWLGGGAKVAGGLGILGGKIVLAGTALAPFVIISGGIAAHKAKQKFNEASNFYDEVSVEVEKIKTVINELAQIRRGAELLQNLVQSLGLLLHNLSGSVENIIAERKKREKQCKELIYDHMIEQRNQKNFIARSVANKRKPIDKETLYEEYRKGEIKFATLSIPSLDYSEEESACIMNTCNTASLLLKVLNTPLMCEEDGAFLSEPISRLEEIKDQISSTNLENERFRLISEANQALLPIQNL